MSRSKRHTYATALVNAGVSLQALMRLLGHVSAEMSLRYAHLFDATVRAEYERALHHAKTCTLTAPAAGGATVEDWRALPLIKSRLAGGHCLRAIAQGACQYANICEHCVNFRTTPTSIPVLVAQRADTELLAQDARQRGWTSETERHQQLLARLDALIEQTS